jgi:type I restriction enzyme R subunit
MNPDQPIPLRFFDHDAERRIVERRLPHWSQAGTVCFITWRTHDSMPKAVLDQWREDRVRWLVQHDFDPSDPQCNEKLQRLRPDLGRVFVKEFWNRWQDHLDAGHGACVLRRPELAHIVTQSLHHFDGQRYLLLDFVIMPNHAHVLVVFPDEDSMLEQCESWKHFTATRINRQLKQRGRFWQQDGFDHLVRSEEQFEYLRDYIAQNPKKAKLNTGEYVLYSKPL